jgi:hypothetical protein
MEGTRFLRDARVVVAKFRLIALLAKTLNDAMITEEKEKVQHRLGITPDTKRRTQIAFNY